ENIAFGDIHLGEDRNKVEGCARQANAEDYISKLPEGYDTPLTRIFEKEGIELSGGQWQKLAIARAFYRDSEIMILDEPTAALDPMAEQEIFNQFDNLREGKTTIFVSHRLSSAVIATKILVLEYGELIEEGNHHELMAKKGKYYDLFTTQAKRYLEGGRDVDEEDRPHRRPHRHHDEDGEERSRRRPSFEE
ncbi:MAG: ABC transporter ATP-binding protein, partial [Clostridia bacterium]|nr:ABC transporter ATP-binding protein [Clostridia bacterium]